MKTQHLLPVGCATIALTTILLFGSHAQADIIITGDITPASPGTWTSSTDGYVGYSIGASGTIAADAGSGITSSNIYIGYARQTTGSATLTGAGSSWNNTNEFAVGYRGNGSLTVQNGATINTGSFVVASQNGSMMSNCSEGAATITGAGSKLMVSTNLEVGYYGTGALTIQDGAIASSANGYIGRYSGGVPYSGTGGTVTVNGAGSTWTNIGALGLGYYGEATLSIQNGADVSTGTTMMAEDAGSTATIDVTGLGSTFTSGYMCIGNIGTATINIQDGASVISSGAVYIADVGRNSSGTISVSGSGSTFTSDFLCVGNYGSGVLKIENGGKANSSSCIIAAQNGSLASVASNGTVSVSGAGSAWTISADLQVGYVGTGVLTIKDGASVSGSTACIGYESGQRRYSGDGGTVTVKGAGSTWTNSGSLLVGDTGIGQLNIWGGGKVTASDVSINTLSKISMSVANNVLVLGSTSTAGSFTNNGSVNFYANAFLAGGTYTPISDSLGRSITWSGTGSYSSVGGTWNSTTHQFTVVPAKNAVAGSTQSINDYDRVIFTDGARQVGMSFGDVASGATASASYMTTGDLAGLSLSSGESVLSAWNFTASGFGSEVLLSYNIGLGASDLEVWHYDGTTWTLYNADDLAYDSNGIASFTVSGFSGYALTGTPVPEPATMGLLIVGGVAALRIRRRRK